MPVVPVVFAFDNNYALPAWIAIKSLIETCNQKTTYEIIILYSHLRWIHRKRISELARDGKANLRLVRVDASAFRNVPKGWSGEATYYRLMVHEILKTYTKAVWSDVDVLFRADISDAFNIDLAGYDWAGVIMERNSAKGGIHSRFSENKNEYIFATGFMVMNLDKMRKEEISRKFNSVIAEYGTRLKMFDLDVLNLSCGSIKPLPLKYCVLENLLYGYSHAPEYTWLQNVYSDEDIADSVRNAVIWHYAGRMPKIWNRNDPASEYRESIRRSPYEHLYQRNLRWRKSILRPSIEKILQIPGKISRKLAMCLDLHGKR